MRILHRYILGELAAYLLIALFFLTFLLLLNKIFQFTDLVVNRGVPLSIVARFLAAALPVLLLATLPMATLIACVMAFSRLSSDSEFVAMTASGMSLYSQLIPVGVVGAAAAVLSGFLMIFSLPWSQSTTAELRRQILHGRAAGFEVRERIFNDRFDGVMIYAREIESPGKVMKGIMISDAREAGKSQVIFADHGMIVKSPASPRIWLRLVKGTIHTVGESGKVSGEKGDAGGGASAIWKSPYRIARFETYDLNVDLTTTIGKAKALQASLRSYPLRELRRKLKEEKPGTSRYRAILVEMNKKFAVPAACLILAFLGAPLGVRNRRSGRHGGFALSLGVLILYYMLVTFAEGMAESGQIRASLAVWGPNMLLALAAGYMVRAVGRRGSFSVPGPLLKPGFPFIRSKA